MLTARDLFLPNYLVKDTSLDNLRIRQAVKLP